MGSEAGSLQGSAYNAGEATLGRGWGDEEGRCLRASYSSSEPCLEAVVGEQSSPPRLQMPHLGLCWHHSILQRGLGCSINGTRGEFSLCRTSSDAKGLTLPLADQTCWPDFELTLASHGRKGRLPF